MRHRINKLVVLVACSAMFAAANTEAADGIKLLRQPSSFPIQITASGSYRLKGRITVPDANTTAILIKDTATDVTIDLNGFAISGPTDCPGVPGPACTPTGSGKGITTECVGPCPIQGTLMIKNGSVRGIGDDGIDVRFAQVRIENVSAHDNGGHGISVNGAVAISHSFANTNGEIGFRVTDPAVVTHSVALANGEQGFFFEGDESGFVLTDNIAARNLGNGVMIEGAPSVVRSSVSSHNFNGLWLDGGPAVIRDSAMYENLNSGIVAEFATIIGNTIIGNDGYGADVENSLAVHNVAMENAFTGLELGTSGLESGAATNATRGNNGGLGEINGGVEIGANLCGTDISCP